jgi:hypothetical protein
VRPPLNGNIVIRTNVRLLLTFVVVLCGCASGAQVRARADARGVHFSFERRGQPVEVRKIEVYEHDGGHRGKTVCELQPASWPIQNMPPLRSWIYGHDVGGYVMHTCSPLAAGHDYGINVFYENCFALTRFRLATSGAAVDLGPNEASCYM